MRTALSRFFFAIFEILVQARVRTSVCLFLNVNPPILITLPLSRPWLVITNHEFQCLKSLMMRQILWPLPWDSVHSALCYSTFFDRMLLHRTYDIYRDCADLD